MSSQLGRPPPPRLLPCTQRQEQRHAPQDSQAVDNSHGVFDIRCLRLVLQAFDDFLRLGWRLKGSRSPRR